MVSKNKIWIRKQVSFDNQSLDQEHARDNNNDNASSPRDGKRQKITLRVKKIVIFILSYSYIFM